eukprot:2702186-Amphidinium_carterae.1
MEPRARHASLLKTVPEPLPCKSLFASSSPTPMTSLAWRIFQVWITHGSGSYLQRVTTMVPLPLT